MRENREINTTMATTISTQNRLKPRRPLPSLHLSKNQSHYRFLCRLFTAGGIIGRNGTIVKFIEQGTNAAIRVDDAVDDSVFRVIHVISDQTPKQRIIVKKTTKEGKPTGEGEEYEVSFAQHALIRVFERVLQIDREHERGKPTNYGKAKCRLLAEKDHIGFLMGKRGKRIRQIEAFTGAKIWVNSDVMLACASADDEMILITGDAFDVKKAILAVTECLQDFPPEDYLQILRLRPSPTNPLGAFSDQQLSPTQSPTLNSSPENAWSGLPVSAEFDIASQLDSKMMQQKVEFKLIATDSSIGGLIGRGGNIVKALENETGASITVGAPETKSDDRLVTIFAFENIQSRYSPAQNAVIRVFTRCRKDDLEKGQEPVSARLMVTSDQIGCLIGQSSSTISEIKRATFTDISILLGDCRPAHASAHDHVVEITGYLGNVQNALFNVTGRLRNHLACKVFETGYQSTRLAYDIDQQATLTESVDRLGLSKSLDRSSSPGQWALRVDVIPEMVQGEKPSVGTQPGRGSLDVVSDSTVMANTTVKMVVPEHMMESVSGVNEPNLNRLRKSSGAIIMVQDPCPGTNERTVIISGTPDQSQAAQSLLRAFLHSVR